MNLQCWKCGDSVVELPLPLGRREECPSCRADLHTCRQCEFYAPSAPQSCREPVADEVREKEKANFCGYFTLKSDAYSPADNTDAVRARVQLDALFGEELGAVSPPADGAQEEAERAREALESLFGLDKPDDAGNHGN